MREEHFGIVVHLIERGGAIVFYRNGEVRQIINLAIYQCFNSILDVLPPTIGLQDVSPQGKSKILGKISEGSSKPRDAESSERCLGSHRDEPS